MDIIKKITVMLWILAIILVAPPVLRYFGVTPKQAILKLLFIDKPSVADEDSRKTVDAALLSNLFADNPEAKSAPADELLPDAHAHTPSGVPATVVKTPQTRPPQAYEPRDEKGFKELISGLERIGSVIKGETSRPEELPHPAERRQPAPAPKVRWLPPPRGFLTGDTFNFLIYREIHPVTNSIKSVLDTIHGNLMLDLTPFTIIVKPSKILVMLFGDKTSYMDFTKRPAWSGASSDLNADAMYVVEGASFYPLSVHELTHLYFDGYFLPTVSPLWLSEGMAVYMQINTTKEKPSWVDQSLRQIISGQHIPIDEMTAAEDLSAYSTPQAQLWYTQAYSLVDYMLNKRTRDEFYTFCNELKNGTPDYQALYRAYGMPFTKMTVLENVWLHDLRKEYEDGRILAPAVSAPAAVQAETEFSPVRREAPAPQRTVIKKLKMVPVPSYTGGF